MTAPQSIEGDSGYTSRERAAIIFSCMLGFALDLYDVLLMPFLMPSIQASLDISLTHVASVTSVTLIGSVIGGALFGWLGDRVGRKGSLQLTLGVFAAGSIASAFAWDYASLAILRFVTGVGLGGEWGAGMVLFNETWNKDRRGLGSAFIQGSAVLASAAASIVGVWATTSFSVDWGWRIALLTGGSPIVLMVFIRFFMPESKAWLQFDRARKAGLIAERASTANTLLLMFRGTLLPTSIMCLLWMMSYMFTYYGIIVFMPTLLQKWLAAPPAIVRNVTVIAAVVGGCSYLAMGALNDAFGRRIGALLPGFFWGIMAFCLYTFASVEYAGSLTGFPMFWTYIAFAIGNSSLGVVGPWLSEIYPIEVRSTAVSFIYMAGRGLGSLAPVVVPIAAAAFGGALALGMLLVVPTIAIFLTITLLLPETRGRSLGFDSSDARGKTA